VPFLIDTHVHLDHPRLAGIFGEVLKLARQNNVLKMINIGHNVASSIASTDLAASNDDIFATVGVHPHSARECLEKGWLADIEKMISLPKVVAIGEIGLDYYYDNSPREDQKQVFRLQLDMACRHKLPVVIHQRDAASDMLAILREFTLEYSGVMHCFSGSVETAREFLSHNLHIGLGGPVTFKNAKKPKAVAAAVPLDKLLVETDAPYMAPHPHRGKTNQPGYVRLVAEEIARIRGISLDEVAVATTNNANKLFRIS